MTRSCRPLRSTSSAISARPSAAADAALRPALLAGSSVAPPQIVGGRPGPPVLAQLRIFRRPATSADRVPPSRLLVGGAAVLSDGVRVARASDGTRFVLSVSRGTPRFPGSMRDPVGCARAEHDASIAAAAYDNAGVQARVRRIVDGRLARVRSVASGATEILTVMRLLPNGHLGGGGATLLANGHVPATGGIGTTRVGGHPRVELSGVIPDGIARVRILDRDGPRGQRARPATVAVRDNVFHVVLPRRMGARMTVEWRAPRGRVVRRVHPRY